MSLRIYHSFKPAAALLSLLLSTGRLFGDDRTCGAACDPACGTEPNCCTKIVYVPAPWSHKKHWCCWPEEPPRARIAESVATIFEAARTTPTNLQVTVQPAPGAPAPAAPGPGAPLPNAGTDSEPNCQDTSRKLTILENDIKVMNENVNKLHGSVQALVTALEKLNPPKSAAAPAATSVPRSAHATAISESLNNQ